MTRTAAPAGEHRVAAFARAAISPRWAVVLLLVALLIAITALNPSFADPSQFVRFIQRVAPIAIVAIGQFFVIVSGEFDLSMGSLVTAQVVMAGTLIGQDDAKVIPTLVIMVVAGVIVGLVNGLVTTLLKVPSFIVTLGTMLAIYGGVLWWTGGAATGNPAESVRQIGRSGITDLPFVGTLPWAVLILAAVTVFAVWISYRPFGRTLIAIGDNAAATAYAGAPVWRTKTLAFVISSLSATVTGILLVGYAGVHPSVGQGYEFIAITAVVLGGVMLGGGRGTVLGALAGAFALESLFMLLNFTSVPSTMRDAIQGAIIIIAVAYSGVVFAAKRRRPTLPEQSAPSAPDEALADPAGAIPSPHPDAGSGAVRG